MSSSKRSHPLTGIITVPISSLSLHPPKDLGITGFNKQHLLGLDLARAKRLARILKDEGEDTLADAQHQISGLVSSKTLDLILRAGDLTPRGLQKTITTAQYPIIEGRFTIWCFRGRRRLLAALLAFGKSCHITVKLYCNSDVRELEGFIRDQSESFIHEATYTDGEIYWHIRKYQDDPLQRFKWQRRLTPSKEKNVKLLLGKGDVLNSMRVQGDFSLGYNASVDTLPHKREHRSIVTALDRLRPYMGHWHGFKLGNIHTNLAARCDELLVYHFDYIADVWDNIVGHDDELKACVDIESVALLQFRAPSASLADRKFIVESMDCGILFPDVSSKHHRQLLKDRLLAETRIIPSLATWEKNMKYIRIGASIIAEHIEVRKSPYLRRSLYQNLSRQWSCPPRSSNTFRHAFILLFLDALRHFPFLSDHRPLQDFYGEKAKSLLNQESIKSFYRRAERLGFTGSKIERGVQQLESAPPETLDFHSSESTSDWRGGKPFLRTFFHLYQTTALLNSLSVPRTMDNITPALVQRDLIRAFFGELDIRDDFSYGDDIEMLDDMNNPTDMLNTPSLVSQHPTSNDAVRKGFTSSPESGNSETHLTEHGIINGLTPVGQRAMLEPILWQNRQSTSIEAPLTHLNIPQQPDISEMWPVETQMQLIEGPPNEAPQQPDISEMWPVETTQMQLIEGPPSEVPFSQENETQGSLMLWQDIQSTSLEAPLAPLSTPQQPDILEMWPVETTQMQLIEGQPNEVSFSQENEIQGSLILRQDRQLTSPLTPLNILQQPDISEMWPVQTTQMQLIEGPPNEVPFSQKNETQGPLMLWQDIQPTSPEAPLTPLNIPQGSLIPLADASRPMAQPFQSIEFEAPGITQLHNEEILEAQLSGNELPDVGIPIPSREEARGALQPFQFIGSRGVDESPPRKMQNRDVSQSIQQEDISGSQQQLINQGAYMPGPSAPALPNRDTTLDNPRTTSVGPAASNTVNPTSEARRHVTGGPTFPSKYRSLIEFAQQKKQQEKPERGILQRRKQLLLAKKRRRLNDGSALASNEPYEDDDLLDGELHHLKPVHEIEDRMERSQARSPLQILDVPEEDVY